MAFVVATIAGPKFHPSLTTPSLFFILKPAVFFEGNRAEVYGNDINSPPTFLSTTLTDMNMLSGSELPRFEVALRDPNGQVFPLSPIQPFFVSVLPSPASSFYFIFNGLIWFGLVWCGCCYLHELTPSLLFICDLLLKVYVTIAKVGGAGTSAPYLSGPTQAKFESGQLVFSDGEIPRAHTPFPFPSPFLFSFPYPLTLSLPLPFLFPLTLSVSLPFYRFSPCPFLPRSWLQDQGVWALRELFSDDRSEPERSLLLCGEVFDLEDDCVQAMPCLREPPPRHRPLLPGDHLLGSAAALYLSLLFF
jgi:hypothetical protein